MSRAWSERSAQLVLSSIPTSDPRLASLLPTSRNVIVVPLFLAGGHRLGIVALERRDGGAMRRWEVAMIEQFAAHAALALYNAWLTAERERQLETISRLEQRQRAHNEELEVTVAERTAELRTVIKDLQEANEQRRKLLHHVVRAAEDERRRIAHDVHDDPVQKLAAVKMRLEMLATKHPEIPDIAESHKVVASTMGSMRRMLFDLSPPILDEEGIGPALEYFLEHSPVSYRWIVQDDLQVRPSTQTRLILYRTAQEALTNARKHAEATIVRVTLQDRDGGVWMEIEDDGVGFEPQRPSSPRPGISGWLPSESEQRWPADGVRCRACPGPEHASSCGCRVMPRPPTFPTRPNDKTVSRPCIRSRTGSRSEVGAAGFEPATSCSQSKCATRLRYAPFRFRVPVEDTDFRPLCGHSGPD